MSLLIKGSLLICSLFVVHLWIKQVLDTEESNHQMEETLESMGNSYAEFQGKISKARKYRHDIPKHLHMMEEAVSDTAQNRYCVDDMLNTIACMKEKKCQENNITMKMDFSIDKNEFLDELNITRVDLAGVIQNLLDNAIEECCRIPELSKRSILWNLTQSQRGLEMQVINTCKNVKDIDFNTKKEDKNAHGWGVKIIREAISTSGGDMEYTKEGTNKICAKIFIPFSREY